PRIRVVSMKRRTSVVVRMPPLPPGCGCGRADDGRNRRVTTASELSNDAPLGLALRGAVFHYIRLLVNGPGMATPVREALAATPTESVLDLGCGCGGFAQAVPGDYVGIDLNPRYIAFARRRFGTPRRRFLCMNLADLDGKQSFDKAIMASILHHLP